MHRKSGGGLILIKTRTQFLETKSYKVIRFWNNDIDNNIESVFLEIDKYRICGKTIIFLANSQYLHFLIMHFKKGNF